ncbi:MAG: DUF6055 domain-containing protein [Bacteroidales bacterium]|nr:DUF6055 domain-containing protein [Bacteroidales bacterium]
MMKPFLLSLVCILLAPLSLQAQKSIYIPSGWSYNSSTKEYTQDGYSYSMSRKRESDNFVVFWSSEYGTTAPDMLPTNDFYYVNINDLLNKAEEFYQLYAETLKFVDPTKSTTMSKYKCMIMLMHSTEWAAYGSGFDFVVPALWINPATCKPVGHTIAHEVGHSFHYMCFAEHNNHRNSNSDNTGFHLACGQGQAIWEQTAQWQAAMAYPQYMFSESYPLFGNNANYAFSHEWMRYQSYWFMYYLCQQYNDITTVAQVWNTPMTGQANGSATDFCSAFIKLKSLTAEQFYALYFDYAMHCATFDFDAASRYRNNYIGRFDYRAVQLDENKYQVAYSSAPQSTGFNVIELNVPASGTTLTTKFTALQPGCALSKADPGLYNNGNANSLVSAGVSHYNTVSQAAARGFRVGYVFLMSNGTRQYVNDDIVHGTGSSIMTEDITATVPTGTSRIFLVVSPALSTYVMHKWDDNIKNDDQWPYQFEIEGTTAKSVTPYIEEPDFELQLDDRRITDVTLTYNVVLPPTNGYDAATVTFSGSGLNALCTAFQLTADELFSKIVNYSNSGPQNGQIMNYPARTDGTLQQLGKTSNGDFGHWFNASGTAVSFGTGCVAYAEFTKSTKSAAVGQYPNANSNGTKRTIREALRYKNANGDIATATFVFNITFKTGTNAYSYLSDIDYVKPEVAVITTSVYSASKVMEPILYVTPGSQATYTLTDDNVTALTTSLSNVNARSLSNTQFKGFIHPMTSITSVQSIYYYALSDEPTLTAIDDEERTAGSVNYYNVASDQNKVGFEGQYTYYYDETARLVDHEDAASLAVSYNKTDLTYTIQAATHCPLSTYTIWYGMVRRTSNNIYIGYYPLHIHVVNEIPTGIETMNNGQWSIYRYTTCKGDLSQSRAPETFQKDYTSSMARRYLYVN